MATVLVLGGYGAVGALIVEQLRAAGDEVFVAGRDRTRADRVIVPGDPASYRRALSTVDVVVNAAGLEQPELVVLASAEGVAFVDITATTGYVAELERLDPKVPVLLSVGLAPGLTNLLAAEVHRLAPGPIDLAVLLGAGERHGAAATAWAYQLLGEELADAGGDRVRNYTKPQTFDLPGFGRRRLYRADYSDQHTLTRDLGVPVRTYFGLDSRLATTALAALTWAPATGRLTQRLHVPGSDRWLVLARGADGTARYATGHGQSHGTAVLAAVAAQAVRGLPAGVHHLHQVCSLADVPSGRDVDLGQ